ncbi:MAG TPA: flagellar type III secretion system pore protein FliP [Acidimicrobiia bacterium]
MSSTVPKRNMPYTTTLSEHDPLSPVRSLRRLVAAIVACLVLLGIGTGLVVSGSQHSRGVAPGVRTGTSMPVRPAAVRPASVRAVSIRAISIRLAAVARPVARPAAPTPPTVPTPTVPTPPTPGATTPTTGNNSGSITLDLGNLTGNGNGTTDKSKQPGQSVVIILLLSLLAVAPALILMLTSFTRIVIVLSLTRNALGLQTIPPNQVVIGLSLFLSLFVMFPTLSQMNKDALQPLLKGDITTKVAYDRATGPLKTFMLKQTRKSELNLFINASKQPKPKTPKDVSMATLIPAFVLSELKTAFIIGFVIFIPFLVIDLVVSSSLMSMGMFMLPPVLVSLPFKLLLFVMVDGWALIVKSLITSFH